MLGGRYSPLASPLSQRSGEVHLKWLDRSSRRPLCRGTPRSGPHLDGAAPRVVEARPTRVGGLAGATSAALPATSDTLGCATPCLPRCCSRSHCWSRPQVAPAVGGWGGGVVEAAAGDLGPPVAEVAVRAIAGASFAMVSSSRRRSLRTCRKV